MKRQHIALIHFCPANPEYDTIRDINPDGLINILTAGQLPDYLQVEKELEDGRVKILRVIQP